jgi:KDO2-lipid IV(A) lauroyltransferase
MGREFTPAEQRKVRQALAHSSRWGGFWYFLIPYRRVVVRKNIHQAFGSFLSRAEELQLVKAYYGHFAKLTWELFVEQHVVNWRKRFVPGILNMSYLTDALQQGQGALLLTAHTGNWEWGLIHAANHIADQTGSRTHVMSRVVRPAWIRKRRIRRLSRTGIVVIENKAGSLRHVIRALRKGDVVVMTIDQHAGAAGSNSVPVPFFGEVTPTFATLAELALRTGSPVVPLCVYRDHESCKHVMAFHEPVEAMAVTATCRSSEVGIDKVAALTASYNAALEQMIVEHPEQWLWSHRRWRGQADESSGRSRQDGAAACEDDS